MKPYKLPNGMGARRAFYHAMAAAEAATGTSIMSFCGERETPTIAFPRHIVVALCRGVGIPDEVITTLSKRSWPGAIRYIDGTAAPADCKRFAEALEVADRIFQASINTPRSFGTNPFIARSPRYRKCLVGADKWNGKTGIPELLNQHF